MGSTVEIRKHRYCALLVHGRVCDTILNDCLLILSIYYFRLGEMCSHVAALLFKVEACVRLGIASTTCTSLPCVWNQAFSKKVLCC